jgi:nitrate/nitrite transporter NarK
MQPAAIIPTPKKNGKPVLKAPRHFGGAISDRYNGAAFSNCNMTLLYYIIIIIKIIIIINPSIKPN